MEDRKPRYRCKMEREPGRSSKRLPEQPKAVLVITGHWEEEEFTVSTSANPPMFYDYYNFPEHTYHIQYPAPGSPAVAARVVELLSQAGIKVGQDAHRGFDHGTFIPFGLIYPGGRHADRDDVARNRTTHLAGKIAHPPRRTARPIA